MESNQLKVNHCFTISILSLDFTFEQAATLAMRINPLAWVFTGFYVFNYTHGLFNVYLFLMEKLEHRNNYICSRATKSFSYFPRHHCAFE